MTLLQNKIIRFSALTTSIVLQLAATVSWASLSASTFDQEDRENLKIYTGQGYYINQDLRSQIPLELLAPLLDKTTSPTCAKLQEAKAPYLNKINVLPYKTMRAEDYKLYYLVQDSLVNRGSAVPRVVYRGVRSCDHLIRSDGTSVKYFLEKAFMSTSTSQEVAQRFTVPMNLGPNPSGEKNAPTGCLLKIEGVSGVSIAEATGNYNNEDEVLFPAGGLFEVLDFQNGGQKVFTVREIAKSDSNFATIREGLLKGAVANKVRGLYPELAAANAKPGASQQLNQDAENACREAYLFFTTNPRIREKLKKTKPAYDLENKKLVPEDYAVEE